MNEQFISDLERLGYFNGLTADQAADLKKVFEQRGWNGIFSESHRRDYPDAEELADGDVGNFIKRLGPFLSTQGVVLPEIEDNWSPFEYTVRVGDRIYKMYDEEESEREAAESMDGLSWGLSGVRAFRIVDELLAAVGSSERVYAMNGGNDLQALILTPDLYRLIMSHPNASRRDGPYRMDEEYPWFGYPHS